MRTVAHTASGFKSASVEIDFWIVGFPHSYGVFMKCFAVGIGHRWLLVSCEMTYPYPRVDSLGRTMREKVRPDPTTFKIVARREPNTTTVLDHETDSPLFEGTVQEFAGSIGWTLVEAPPTKDLTTEIRDVLERGRQTLRFKFMGRH